jgi:hypothetical protein
MIQDARSHEIKTYGQFLYDKYNIAADITSDLASVFRSTARLLHPQFIRVLE